MLAIIDYQVGNLLSIQNMLFKIGKRDVVITNEEDDIIQAEKIIIPGVGHFDYGISKLRNAPFFETLNHRVINEKVPVLGICLGAQLLLEKSEEGNLPGLGWLKGGSVKFDTSKMNEDLKVPHMGWSEVEKLKESRLLTGLPEDPRYYFVHTYHFHCQNPEHHLLKATYGYDFIAAFESDNILGVQFHPEKSHRFGMQILKNFITQY